jgi:probable DNA metabolism protein
MIRCSPNPESMLKAAILGELTGQPAQLKIPDEQPSLFSSLDEMNADCCDLRGIMGDLSLKTGCDFGWINRYPGRRIAIMILFNLRNRSGDSAAVIFSALSEAIRYGPGYCIWGRGKESSVFRRRSREVGNEIHRMMGLIRFNETGNGDLVARPKLFHHTADIVLRKFQLRYPLRRLVFILPDEALSCEQGRIRHIDMQDLPLSLLNPTDDFSELWETYYRSQYIPERKNIRLASHFIPKKYWDWLPEGKILKQEADK